MEPADAEPPHRRRILIVDDEPMMRVIMRRALTADGFELEEAVDGRAALDTFMQDPARYLMVIVDLMMPRVRGDEAARQMRARDEQVHIIAVSGFPPELDADARRAIDHFLPKPFRPDELRELVLGVLHAA